MCNTMPTYSYSCGVKARFMLNFVCKIVFLYKEKPRLRRAGKQSYKAAILRTETCRFIKQKKPTDDSLALQANVFFIQESMHIHGILMA